MTSRVFTVPPGRPFLDSLARAILAGDLPSAGGRKPDPIELPAYTLLLPTRRATRAVQEAFLRVSGGKAMLLPRILPIAEGQEDLTLLERVSGSDAFAAGDLDVPPAVSKMERLLALTSLVMRWSEAMGRSDATEASFLSDRAISMPGGTPAQAAQLAAELTHLMDMVETENVSYAGLAGLVPEEHSAHWQKTLQFLDIVTSAWPQYLSDRGLTSTVDRRNKLILAEAARYASAPPAGPVIVAGVTGSIPATAELMRQVAALPKGAIVLPGLDTALDTESWDRIVPDHPEHPQFGLKILLDRLGLTRDSVSILKSAEPSPLQKRRLALVAEAMRPSATTERWAEFVAGAGGKADPSELDGLTLVEVPSAQDEAEAIALILREAAEMPGRTAALVSPDRLLARRVAIRLETWGIRVDDSAGRPFPKTVPGAFLDLVVEAAAKNFAPAELMALLKHPLTRLGLDPFSVRRAARALEIAVFRAPYLGDGLAGVDAALERAAINAKPGSGKIPHSAVRRLWDDDWAGARDLVQRLAAACAPLVAVNSSSEKRLLSVFADAHMRTAEAIAKLPDAPSKDEAQTIASPLWEGEAGATAHTFFESLFAPDLTQPEISSGDYPDLYRSLLVGENVRPRVPVHPRLFIWGPFEARLQQTDVMVLGSLNDGTWPESADPGPWLNRPMRKALGLPSPEEKIGHAAHDFTSLLGAERVVLTRALKINGVPTVPSRWLMRLNALIGGLGLSDRLMSDAKVVSWAGARDRVKHVPQTEPPKPRPPVDLRPRKLSVSRVETWIANPYAIFAREILGLEPLDPIGQDPGAALRGSIIHAALAEFAKKHPGKLPADVQTELLARARDVFAEYDAHPRVAAFWLPRFVRFADWFAATEAARRSGVTQVVAETSGKLVIDGPAGPFTLSARADRIDIAAHGLVITDYKTGTPPSSKKVLANIAPQLPLEAAMAAAGVFDSVPARPIVALRYISASGGDPPGKDTDIKCEDFAALAASAIAGLTDLVRKFDDLNTPYEPKRRARFSYDYDAYAQLARVAEWSVETGATEEV